MRVTRSIELSLSWPPRPNWLPWAYGSVVTRNRLIGNSTYWHGDVANAQMGQHSEATFVLKTLRERNELIVSTTDLMERSAGDQPQILKLSL